MASIQPKKLAAAVAAVLQYAAEADAAAGGGTGLCALSPGAEGFAPALGVLPPLWGWAGRQEAMHDRSSRQRRVAKSW